MRTTGDAAVVEDDVVSHMADLRQMLVGDCLRAATAYERSAKRHADHPDAGQWLDLAKTCRRIAAMLIGDPFERGLDAMFGRAQDR